jgi:hypothetical protein
MHTHTNNTSIRALLCIAGFLAWGSNASAPKVTHETTDNHPIQIQSGTAEAPVLFQEIKRPPSQLEIEERKEANARERRRDDREAQLTLYTKELMLFTALLAFATILLAAATGYLVKASFAQVRDAKDSIAAARKSAEVAEAALTQVERPWLALTETEISWEYSNGRERPRLALGFKNIGRMPAIIVKCEYRSEDLASAPARPDYSNVETAGGNLRVLAPGDTTTTAEIGAPDNINMSPSGYLLFGQVVYRDLPGNEHHTGFVVQIVENKRQTFVPQRVGYEWFD